MIERMELEVREEGEEGDVELCHPQARSQYHHR